MRRRHPYVGLPTVLATRHAKERAIAPALAREPGLNVLVADGLDTDQLGTFTGEIERPAPPQETALMKARLGIEASGVPRGLASEGAFGPDPRAFFIPFGLELIAFVDLEFEIEIVEKRLCRDSNFAHLAIANLDREAEDFLARVGFPAHAVVVRPNVAVSGGEPRGDGALSKGLQSRRETEEAIGNAAHASADGLARLETDMRAHLNPTRMNQIEVLARQLGTRLATLCEDCGAPGYGVINTRPGLPCAVCGTPTEWIAIEIEGCGRCGGRREQAREDGLRAADPAHCPRCNP